MLVSPCTKNGLPPTEDLPSFENVREDQGIEMAYMRGYSKSESAILATRL